LRTGLPHRHLFPYPLGRVHQFSLPVPVVRFERWLPSAIPPPLPLGSLHLMSEVFLPSPQNYFWKPFPCAARGNSAPSGKSFFKINLSYEFSRFPFLHSKDPYASLTVAHTSPSLHPPVPFSFLGTTGCWLLQKQKPLLSVFGGIPNFHIRPNAEVRLNFPPFLRHPGKFPDSRFLALASYKSSRTFFPGLSVQVCHVLYFSSKSRPKSFFGMQERNKDFFYSLPLSRGRISSEFWKVPLLFLFKPPSSSFLCGRQAVSSLKGSTIGGTLRASFPLDQL